MGPIAGCQCQPRSHSIDTTPHKACVPTTFQVSERPKEAEVNGSHRGPGIASPLTPLTIGLLLSLMPYQRMENIQRPGVPHIYGNPTTNALSQCINP
jgi:hypothetical protein